MMVAKTFFDKRINIFNLLNSLNNLPELIRPLYFSTEEGEINKENVVSNKENVKCFLKNNSIGFFLYSKDNICINVSSPNSEYIEVILWLPDQVLSDLAVQFLFCLTDLEPVFGFACDSKEYEYRNRYRISIEKNKVESWVGRKLTQYVSGIYWYTLISDVLVDKFNINLLGLESESLKYNYFDQQHLSLFNFYKKPEDWVKNSENLDNFCENNKGFFYKGDLDKMVQNITDYFEYSKVIDDWR